MVYHSFRYNIRVLLVYPCSFIPILKSGQMQVLLMDHLLIAFCQSTQNTVIIKHSIMKNIIKNAIKHVQSQ